MKKLTRYLKQALLDGSKEAGTHDPKEVIPRIEETLTVNELTTAETFLDWIHSTKRSFGWGNIDDQFAAWKAAGRKA